MKPKSLRKLRSDLSAGSLAASRRKGNRCRLVATAGASLVIAGIVLSTGSQPKPEGRGKETTASTTIVSQDENPVPEAEEDLLDELADAGPIVVTMPDGSRLLYLTRP